MHDVSPHGLLSASLFGLMCLSNEIWQIEQLIRMPRWVCMTFGAAGDLSASQARVTALSFVSEDHCFPAVK
jgi:hypothetical protein